MKTYKVGLLGFGFIGKVHACSYQNLPFFYAQNDFQAQITKVAASTPSSSERAARTLGNNVVGVCDFRAITEDPEIDIVNICTPNHLHFEALKSAIKHGKHIYCDKPLTGNVAQAEELAELLKEYRQTAQMTLQNRFYPATLRAKELIDSGAVGRILEFRGRYLHSGSSDPEAPYKWKLAAGTVADLGTHILDLLSYLTGDFTEVMGSTSIAYAERPNFDNPSQKVPVKAEDNMFVLAKLASGACGSIEASKIATGSEDEISFAIHGTNGAIRLDAMNPGQLFFYDRTVSDSPHGGMRGWTAIDCNQRYEPPAGFPTPKAPIGWLRSHIHSLYCFLENVHGQRPGTPGLERGIYLEHLNEAIKRSADERSWQKLNEL